MFLHPAIAKQLVELHGGTLVAESEGEGKGATFTATLPLPRSSGEQRDAPTNLRALPQGINNLRVLLVEDDSGHGCRRIARDERLLSNAARRNDP